MGPWSWSCDGCDFDNDGSPEIYIACGMLTNNSRRDLMSYFYRQVVAKSPVKTDARARLRERLECDQPIDPSATTVGRARSPTCFMRVAPAATTISPA